MVRLRPSDPPGRASHSRMAGCTCTGKEGYFSEVQKKGWFVRSEVQTDAYAYPIRSLPAVDGKRTGDVYKPVLSP